MNPYAMPKVGNRYCICCFFGGM